MALTDACIATIAIKSGSQVSEAVAAVAAAVSEDKSKTRILLRVFDLSFDFL